LRIFFTYNIRSGFLLKEKMMKKFFYGMTAIKMSTEQDQQITKFVDVVQKYDTEHEVQEIYLDMIDVTNHVLNQEFCPMVFTKTAHPSDNLYEAVRSACTFIPEYISRIEQIPRNAVILWQRKEETMENIFRLGNKIKYTQEQKALVDNVVSTLVQLDKTGVIEGIHIAKYCVDSDNNLLNRVDMYVEFDSETEIPEAISDYMLDVCLAYQKKDSAELSAYLITEYTGPDFPQSFCVWQKGGNV